ncbi:MAG: ArsR/SmtB family transcription factor [Ktedonobacterales bacterium]
MDESSVADHDYLELKRILRALGDVVRLSIVNALAGCTEMNVTDLAQMLVVNGRLVSQPLVSWHLAMLRRVGLVCTRRVGRLVYCSLDRDRYQTCLRLLGELVEAAPGTTASVMPLPSDATGARRA